MSEDAERLLTDDEIREGMRLAMAKAGRHGKVILFGGYSRGDWRTDVDIMVVVDSYRRGLLQDTSELRRCIELDCGIALHVWPAEKFEEWKDALGTAAYEATHYGRLLFDDLERPSGG